MNFFTLKHCSNKSYKLVGKGYIKRKAKSTRFGAACTIRTGWLVLRQAKKINSLRKIIKKEKNKLLETKFSVVPSRRFDEESARDTRRHKTLRGTYTHAKRALEKREKKKNSVGLVIYDPIVKLRSVHGCRFFREVTQPKRNWLKGKDFNIKMYTQYT